MMLPLSVCDNLKRGAIMSSPVTLVQGNPQSFFFRRKLKFLFRDSSWDCQVAILEGLAWLAGPSSVIAALSPDYFNLLSVPPMFQ